MHVIIKSLFRLTLDMSTRHELCGSSRDKDMSVPGIADMLHFNKSANIPQI